MALYCIGDVQGCDRALGQLLERIGFSPSRDTVYLLGDLVNRGPDSTAVLRRCMAHGDALRPLLGNHDLHLLAVAHGARKPGRNDTLQAVLDAPDRPALQPPSDADVLLFFFFFLVHFVFELVFFFFFLL